MLRLRPPPWTLLLAAALCNSLILLAFLFSSPSDLTRTCPTLSRKLHYVRDRPIIALAAQSGSGSGFVRAMLQVASGYRTGAVTNSDPAPGHHLERSQVENVIVVATKNLTLSLGSGIDAERVVHLVRNPFATVALSFLLSPAGERYKRSGTLIRDEWERHVHEEVVAWRHHVRFWQMLRRDSDRYHLVRYEDLVHRRHVALTSLLTFVDVEPAAKRLTCAYGVRHPQMKDFMELYSNAQRRWVLEYTRIERTALGYNGTVPLNSKREFIINGESDMGFPLQCRSASVFSRAIAALHGELKESVEHTHHSETEAERELRLSEPPMLLSWNRDDWMGWLKQESFFSDWQGVNITKTASKCRWSRDRNLLKSATVVLFSAIRHQNTHQSEWCNEKHDLPTWKKWGALNYETAQQFSLLSHDSHSSLYDWKIGWEKNAHFGISMNCPFPTSRSLTDPPSRKDPAHIAAYFASRCMAQDRDSYVSELMQHIEVHSYGACLNNKRLKADEEQSWPRNWGAKIEAMSTYFFALAFENAEYEHWVTEKMPQAIYAGTVPVYWGAPDVELFAPGPHSVIRTADFASPRELGDYLMYLTRNSTAYEEYFAWKKGPISAGWQVHRANCAFFAQEKICDAAIALQHTERNEKTH